MSYDSVSPQEAAWPKPSQEQVLCLFQESSRAVLSQKKRPGRPASVTWSHLCLGIVLCFLRGWHAQLDLWRLICTERLGEFAPVQICDQVIYNRLERAGEAMRSLFEQVSQWLQTRRGEFSDRSLAPWATEVFAVDESTLDKVGRWLPWLRRQRNGRRSALRRLPRPVWGRSPVRRARRRSDGRGPGGQGGAGWQDA